MAKSFGYVVGQPSSMQTIEEIAAEEENLEEVQNENILSDEPES